MPRRKADKVSETSPITIPPTEIAPDVAQTPSRGKKRPQALISLAAVQSIGTLEVDQKTPSRSRSSRRTPPPDEKGQIGPDTPSKARPESEPDVRSESRRPRAKSAAPKKTGQAEETRSEAEPPRTVIFEGEKFPVPTWRPNQPDSLGDRANVANPEQAADIGDEKRSNLAPRRSRNRRRIDLRDREISATVAVPTRVAPQATASGETEDFSDRPARGDQKRRPRAEPVAKLHAAGAHDQPPGPQPRADSALPMLAPRAPFPTPERAPRIVLRDQVPTLVRDGRVYPPIFFFGHATDASRAATVIEEVRLATESGVRLITYYVDLEVDPKTVDDAVSMAAYLLASTLKVAPDAQVLFRVVFGAPRGWERSFPDAKYVAESGGLAEPSVCDDKFWSVAEECLATFIRKLRLLEFSDHLLGVHLDRGEWFFAEGWGYDTSPAAHQKFQDWCRMRYRDDVVALRASWFDGQVQFQTIALPEYDQKRPLGEEFVRTGRKTRRFVDYHLFLSDVTVERIMKLANVAKRASEGWFLVGVSYGYTFEWSHPASGHLSLGKLLRAPEIDFIAGPPSYKNREPGRSAPFPCPVDSVALNGKLYISEEDFKTPISGRQEPDDFNPVMRTPQALESVHWRGAGVSLAHLGGLCWMDLWGNGWLNTPVIWQRAKKVSETLIRRMAAPVVDPEVAVFIDERSLAYLVDQSAFELLVQNVREAVLRSGLSVGFYLLSDLAHRERFPESKLHIFMNAWDIRPETRSAIKNRLQRNGKVLFWLYCSGLFDGGRESLERVREVTGIALKRQPFASRPGTTLLNRRHPLTETIPEKTLSKHSKLEPSYFAIPEDGLVLAEYTQTGLPSFVVRDFQGDGKQDDRWTSVFLGEPVVTPELIRALGQIAGAHVWNHQEDIVHVRTPFLTIHCPSEGQRALTLPNKWSAYNVLTGQWVVSESTYLRFEALEGSTHTFMVGPKAEIEALLARDPSELLAMSEIPPQPENTLKQDSVVFDIGIMKIGEWVEESWSEEMADDLLIKPSMLDFDLSPATPESIQPSRSRNRRQRENRPSKGRREGADVSSEVSGNERRNDPPGDENDFTMNVVFRKRR